MLGDFFGVPVARRGVRRATGSTLPPAEPLAAGRGARSRRRLGAVDDRSARASGPASSKFRLVLGPLTRDAVPADFCPGGEPAAAGRAGAQLRRRRAATGTCGCVLEDATEDAAARWASSAGWAGRPGSGRAGDGARDVDDLVLDPSADASGRRAEQTSESETMSEISRVALFGKLNSLGYKAIEGATVFCKLRGNPYVELVHWIHQILQTPDSDLHRIVRHFELDPSRLAKDMTEALDRLPRGATLDLRPLAARRGRGRARLGLRDADVRRVAGAHRPPDRRHAQDAVAAQRAARDLAAVREASRPTTLTDDFARIVSGLAGRQARRASDGSSLAAPGRGERRDGAGADGQAGGAASASPSTSPSGRARARSIRSIGRDEEIRQIVDILMRRRQNNPILTGEAGVGKTAVVEGFALRIARGDVPPPLQGRVAAARSTSACCRPARA